MRHAPYKEDSEELRRVHGESEEGPVSDVQSHPGHDAEARRQEHHDGNVGHHCAVLTRHILQHCHVERNTCLLRLLTVVSVIVIQNVLQG